MKIPRNCTYPWGYAPAYVDFCNDATVAYFFPFNLIVRWARNIYYRTNAISPKRLQDNPYYRKGHRAGYIEGYLESNRDTEIGYNRLLRLES